MTSLFLAAGFSTCAALSVTLGLTVDPVNAPLCFGFASVHGLGAFVMLAVLAIRSTR